MRIKKEAKVEIFSSGGKGSKQYKGRVLGFITEDEFKKILENTDLGRKILSEESLSLSDISDTDVKDLRLCFSVKEVEGEYKSKRLLVTDVLDVIQHYKPAENTVMWLTTKEDGWILIEEVGQQLCMK
jgi:hypothetical protein